MNRSITSLCCLAVVLAHAGCGSKEETTSQPTPPEPPKKEALELSFGVYTSDKPTDMIKQFRPVLDQLESAAGEKLDRPVEIRMEVANTYEKGIENLVEGAVDLSQLGPASYITAKTANPDLSIVAVESNGGEKVFYGVICVHEDSPIQSVTELKGKTFAFGSELSTIGRYLSQEYLMDHGVKAADLGKYEYLGRHDKVGASVGLGEHDGGVLKEGTFKKLVAGGTKIREIARFPNVTKPWVARAGLDSEIVKILRQALIELKDEEALATLRVDGFLEGSDDDYSPIRKSMDRNGAFVQ